MFQPRIAVLIPSRMRPLRLLKAISSIMETASGDNVEILLRLDRDDPTMPMVFSAFPFNSGVEIYIGERGRGYAELNKFYAELEEWCWYQDWIVCFNDDSQMLTKGWDEELLRVPSHVNLAQFRIENVGELPEGGPFPAWRRGCFKRYGYEMIPDPVDYHIDKILCKDNREPWHCLDAVIRHERDNDEELAKHRAL